MSENLAFSMCSNATYLINFLLCVFPCFSKCWASLTNAIRRVSWHEDLCFRWHLTWLSIRCINIWSKFHYIRIKLQVIFSLYLIAYFIVTVKWHYSKNLVMVVAPILDYQLFPDSSLTDTAFLSLGMPTVLSDVKNLT